MMKPTRTRTFPLCLLLLLLLVSQGVPAQEEAAHPLAINVARTEVLEDVQKAWSEADPFIPYFDAVELKSKEYRRIFPHGMGHLPDTLVPRAIYPATTETGSRRWQYLGTRTLRGFKFAIFRLVTTPENN